jgi:hypothetical protein
MARVRASTAVVTKGTSRIGNTPRKPRKVMAFEPT